METALGQWTEQNGNQGPDNIDKVCNKEGVCVTQSMNVLLPELPGYSAMLQTHIQGNLC